MQRADAIQKILEQSQDQHKKYIGSQQQHHKSILLRSILIVIDLTDTMSMKDIKPSRLTVATQAIKHFIKKIKDITPIVKISIGIAQEQLCKVVIDFTYSEKQLEDALDRLKVNRNTSKVSFENVLRTTLKSMQSIPLYEQRQLLYIQSYPATMDYKNINQTMRIFKQSGIKINIVSLVTKSYFLEQLVQACKGKYQTVGSQQHFRVFMEQISRLSPYNMNQTIQSTIKMALVRKQASQIKIQCFCHMKYCRNYYICGICSAVLCTQPPMQCAICGILLILPVDLYRHKGLK